MPCYFKSAIVLCFFPEIIEFLFKNPGQIRYSSTFEANCLSIAAKFSNVVQQVLGMLNVRELFK